MSSKTVLDHLRAMFNVAGVDINTLDDNQIAAMGSHLQQAVNLMATNPYKLALNGWRDQVGPRTKFAGRSGKTGRRMAKTKKAALRERQRITGTIEKFREKVSNPPRPGTSNTQNGLTKEQQDFIKKAEERAKAKGLSPIAFK